MPRRNACQHQPESRPLRQPQPQRWAADPAISECSPHFNHVVPSSHRVAQFPQFLPEPVFTFRANSSIASALRTTVTERVFCVVLSTSVFRSVAIFSNWAHSRVTSCVCGSPAFGAVCRSAGIAARPSWLPPAGAVRAVAPGGSMAGSENEPCCARAPRRPTPAARTRSPTPASAQSHPRRVGGLPVTLMEIFPRSGFIDLSVWRNLARGSNQGSWKSCAQSSLVRGVLACFVVSRL
jgi:hypothetical protein